MWAEHLLNLASKQIVDVQWLYILSGVGIPAASFPFGHKAHGASLLDVTEPLKNVR